MYIYIYAVVLPSAYILYSSIERQVTPLDSIQPI